MIAIRDASLIKMDILARWRRSRGCIVIKMGGNLEVWFVLIAGPRVRRWNRIECNRRRELELGYDERTGYYFIMLSHDTQKSEYISADVFKHPL